MKRVYREVNPKEIKSGTINIREDIGDITPIINKINVRLAKGKSGIAVPLIVAEIDDADYNFEVVDGERRLAGALEVGLEKVPIVIAEASVDETLSWDSFDANDARLGNNWYEIGKFFSRENKGGMTYLEIGERAGLAERSVGYYVSCYRKLSNCPRGQNIESLGTAKVIIDKGNPSDYQRIVDKVVETKLSWRDTEKLLDKVNTIREKIYQVEDDEKRAKLFAQFEPIIYEDIITVQMVESTILDSLGVAIWTSQKLKMSDRLIKGMEKFSEMYPESCEYTEGEEGSNMWIHFKLWVNKEEFARVVE